MSQFIPCEVSWTDNSSGDRDELGSEVDIYTDSPSFVPNVPVEGDQGILHPWMRLPAVGAGATSIAFRLELPVTFVVVRVRQYNAHGPGAWDSPAGTRFAIDPASGASAPQAPSATGFTVGNVAVPPPPPPPPPVDPPPPPPPTGGGTQANYVWTSQFSGVQGQNQWSYRDSLGNLLTYDAANSVWRGTGFLGVWNGGATPESDRDVIIRWTAPASSDARVQVSVSIPSTSGDGGNFTIKHNSTTKWSQAVAVTTVYTRDETFAVSSGDTIDFIANKGGSFSYDNFSLTITITAASGGTTTSPVLSTLLPSALGVAVGGVSPLTVTLSSAPAAQATVTVVSSDPTKATVPASVIVPAGQTSATIQVTGVAAGSSTVTATHNSTNVQSTITVVNPATGTWSNMPAGMTVLFDSPLDSLTGLIDDYPPGSTPVTIADAPFSPSKAIRHRLEPLALTGGGQVRYRANTQYREMYAGMYWRSNPQFQGRTAGNKVFFLRGNPGSNGVIYWIGPRAAGGGFTAPLFFSMNGQTENKHILGPASDAGSAFGHNVGNSTVVAGVWYKLEWRIRCSTTLTSQDGILQMWLNGVLTHSYLNINYSPHGLNEWVMNQTWDGSGDMGVSNTMAWEYYLDHLVIAGKN